MARGRLLTGRPQQAREEASMALKRSPQGAEAPITWAQASAANLANMPADTPEKLLKIVRELRKEAPREEQSLVLHASLEIQAKHPENARAAIEAALAE